MDTKDPLDLLEPHPPTIYSVRALRNIHVLRPVQLCCRGSRWVGFTRLGIGCGILRDWFRSERYGRSKASPAAWGVRSAAAAARGATSECRQKCCYSTQLLGSVDLRGNILWVLQSPYSILYSPCHYRVGHGKCWYQNGSCRISDSTSIENVHKHRRALRVVYPTWATKLEGHINTCADNLWSFNFHSHTIPQ